MDPLSQNLLDALHQALIRARNRRHQYAEPEHLLAALLDDGAVAAVLARCGADIDRLRQSVSAHLDTIPEHENATEQTEPHVSIAFQQAVQRAVIRVQSTRELPVNAVDMLQSLLATPDYAATRLLNEARVTEAKIQEAVRAWPPG